MRAWFDHLVRHSGRGVGVHHEFDGRKERGSGRGRVSGYTR
jgi:hypothetical protein